MDSDWRSIRTLGRGNFGVVELWKNNKTQQFNAIKRFELRATGGHVVSDKAVETYKKLWQKEVDLMSTIKSCPYIVSAKPMPEDLVIPNSFSPALFMEYCSGGNLRSVLKLPENISGLRQSDALTILDHISNAINFLHSIDIVHRDLKPDNILRCYDGHNKVTYKLSDLGLHKDVSDGEGQCSTFLGTPQYLAPEIYMGKSYDKTVDYWSFGIIAFEIMCGLRPFLHGESHANWLPLIEKKGNDEICIYRTNEGKIMFSNGIPFYTHFTEVMKECMIIWLRTMLQSDPSKRGRTILETMDETATNSQVVNMKLLTTTLSTKFLEIQGVKETMEFPVGSKGRTTVGDIQQRISIKTGLIPENQLLLTADGIEILKSEVVSKFLSMDIYLLPRCVSLLRLQVKFPKIVHSFISESEWETMKDPTKLRKIWACAIYYLQSELRKVDVAKKSNEALKAWCTKSYTNQLMGLRMAIEKAGSSLGTILELEGQLDSIDEKHLSEKLQSFSQRGENGDASKTGCRYWEGEMTKLHNHYKLLFDSWVENVVLKIIRTTELEELYYKILKACSDWKSSDSSSPPFSYNEILVRNLCQFIIAKQAIDKDLHHNIWTLLEKAKSEAKLMEEMKSVITQLHQLTFDAMQQRCAKYTSIIHKLNGTDIPSSVTEAIEMGKVKKEDSSDEKDDKSNSKSPIPNPIRGGGFRIPESYAQRRMCNSSMPSSEGSSGGSSIQVLKRMSKSCNPDLRKSLHEQCPLLNSLLKESQVLQARTKENIESLNNSLEEINEMKKERESINWDFLKK